MLLAALFACSHAAPLSESERSGEIVRFRSGAEAAPKVLRAVARPVDASDPALPGLLAALEQKLAAQGGVGLAAPQIGVSRRVVLVVRGTRPKGGAVRVERYVNPAIAWASRETNLDYEACLSVEGGGGLVRRHDRLRVAHEPPGGGARLETELEGWDARIFQHELDHLDGVLFIDRLEGPLVSMEEMRRLRDEEHRKRGWIPPEPVPAK